MSNSARIKFVKEQIKLAASDIKNKKQYRKDEQRKKGLYNANMHYGKHYVTCLHLLLMAYQGKNKTHLAKKDIDVYKNCMEILHSWVVERVEGYKPKE